MEAFVDSISYNWADNARRKPISWIRWRPICPARNYVQLPF